MKKVKLAKMPAKRAQDFWLAGKKYARVIYKPVESKPDRVVIEAQAFQVDAKGQLVAYETGEPSRTPSTSHTISVTGLGDTHTLDPGWVRVAGTFDFNAGTGLTNSVPEGTKKVTSLPATGSDGAHVWYKDALYRWDKGILQTILEGKAAELENLLKNSATLQTFTL